MRRGRSEDHERQRLRLIDADGIVWRCEHAAEAALRSGVFGQQANDLGVHVMPLLKIRLGAILGEAVFTEPGARPMTDAEARPFAALRGLKGTLAPEE